jgi:hypothetical protein
MQHADHPRPLKRGQVVSQLPDPQVDHGLRARQLRLDDIVEQLGSSGRRACRGRYTWARPRM